MYCTLHRQCVIPNQQTPCQCTIHPTRTHPIYSSSACTKTSSSSYKHPIESQHSSHHVPTPQISLRTPKTRPVLPTHPPSSPLQSPNHTTQETNKMENSRRKLPQLMPHHILRDRHLVVDLPVMHLELQPHEIRQDGGGSRLGFYRRCALARLRADDGESGDCV